MSKKGTRGTSGRGRKKKAETGTNEPQLGCRTLQIKCIWGFKAVSTSAGLTRSEKTGVVTASKREGKTRNQGS